MAKFCSLIFLCLTGSPQVRGCGCSTEPAVAKGSVNCRLLDQRPPTVTERLAADLAAIGVDFADAPLSRNPKEAWEGALRLHVGAEQAVFSRIDRDRPPWPQDRHTRRQIVNGHRRKRSTILISLGYARRSIRSPWRCRAKWCIPGAEFRQGYPWRAMDCGSTNPSWACAWKVIANRNQFTLKPTPTRTSATSIHGNELNIATTMTSAVKNSSQSSPMAATP